MYMKHNHTRITLTRKKENTYVSSEICEICGYINVLGDITYKEYMNRTENVGGSCCENIQNL